MWSIEMFPAAQGDALWIEYGQDDDIHRVLIDGGMSPTFDHLRARLETLDPLDRRFELLVVTHVDADHIEGIVRLLGDEGIGLKIDEIWFNGWQHISDALGPLQGEYLSALIERRDIAWNEAFDRHAVVVGEAGSLPKKPLPGGMELTLLSPMTQQLADLAAVWRTEVDKAGLMPGVTAEAYDRLLHDARLRPPADLLGGGIDVAALATVESPSDHSEANASSIVLLAEFDGARCLLGADGVTDVLDVTVPRLLQERGIDTLELDASKLPHHGSKFNVNRALVEGLPAKRYLFSTSGARFGHPDQEAVARVLVHGGRDPELVFNYRSEDNDVWDDEALKTEHSYTTTYPAAGTLGVSVEL